ncbi:hypothetical protein AC094_18110 [Bacteroides fragilis]|uniref:Uncharacterized protein n=1 Tax=Bacteroides fragilis TaxID=817 RepID=A0A853PXG1_BACFG|nr:hypothetical protein M075_1995 [Bacteroides fragilis str. 20793-3]OCR32187.1 hypothetical protein AC094_18110 [Bacteroides fragilis]
MNIRFFFTTKLSFHLSLYPRKAPIPRKRSIARVSKKGNIKANS